MTSQEKPYYTDFLSKQEVILQFVKCSRQFVKSFHENMISSDDLLKVSVADGYGFINHVAKINAWPDFVRKIYLQCFFTSDNIVKSSGNIATYFFAYNFLANKKLEYENTDIRRSSADLSFHSLSKFIDGNIFDFVRDVINHTGINGQLNIRKTDSSLPAIELSSCHKFNIGLHPEFVKNSVRRDEAKVLVFDGAIKSIGQVDRLFNECHEQSTTCILFARSYSNDVISTLNANQSRRTLDIFPIVAGDSISNINVLGDIALCTGSELITAESGVRISNVTVSDLKTMNGVKLDKFKTTFNQNPLMNRSVAKRMSEIRKKIELAMWNEGMSKEDIEAVYGGRLLSMNSNSIVIWVPGDDSFVQYLNNIFSFSIGYISAFANSGYIAVEIPELEFQQKLPANIVDISLSVSESIYESICNSGGCVAIQ